MFINNLRHLICRFNLAPGEYERGLIEFSFSSCAWFSIWARSSFLFRWNWAFDLLNWGHALVGSVAMVFNIVRRGFMSLRYVEVCKGWWEYFVWRFFCIHIELQLNPLTTQNGLGRYWFNFLNLRSLKLVILHNQLSFKFHYSRIALFCNCFHSCDSLTLSINLFQILICFLLCWVKYYIHIMNIHAFGSEHNLLKARLEISHTLLAQNLENPFGGYLPRSSLFPLR